jgi:Uma2 family endonuclease
MTTSIPEGSMTAMPVMPYDVRDWTVDDLDLIPDDGLQYELLDGLLLVTPAPTSPHQRASARLFLLLTAACSPGLEIFYAPLDWRPDRHTSLQPDLLIVRDGDVEIKNITRPLMLAVEILSPSTRRKDLFLKRSKYQDAGVQSYWIVDPQAPSITALELVDGQYVTAGEATGDAAVTLEKPFPVTIVPATLIKRPRA